MGSKPLAPDLPIARPQTAIPAQAGVFTQPAADGTAGDPISTVSVRLDQVSAGYGARRVVRGVTTGDIPAGRVVAILGPNAAGKSTLLKRMAGLAPGEGCVHLTGSRAQNGAGSGRDGRQPTLGYMPQQIDCDARLTVYEALAIARKLQVPGWRMGQSDLDAVAQVLDDLGMAAMSSRWVGELSGGQRQMVSLAQMLVRRPDVMLLDEPTSALDLKHQVRVLDYLARLARTRGGILFVVLHDLNMALRHADDCLVLCDGGMHAFGPMRQIIHAELLASVYGVRGRIEQACDGMAYLLVESALG